MRILFYVRFRTEFGQGLSLNGNIDELGNNDPGKAVPMNESTVGSAAIAHLLPLIDHVDMDGPLLLGEDVATGIKYDYGKISYSDQPGLGIQFTGNIEQVNREQGISN